MLDDMMLDQYYTHQSWHLLWYSFVVVVVVDRTQLLCWREGEERGEERESVNLSLWGVEPR